MPRVAQVAHAERSNEGHADRTYTQLLAAGDFEATSQDFRGDTQFLEEEAEAAAAAALAAALGLGPPAVLDGKTKASARKNKRASSTRHAAEDDMSAEAPDEADSQDGFVRRKRTKSGKIIERKPRAPRAAKPASAAPARNSRMRAKTRASSASENENEEDAESVARMSDGDTAGYTTDKRGRKQALERHGGLSILGAVVGSTATGRKRADARPQHAAAVKKTENGKGKSQSGGVHATAASVPTAHPSNPGPRGSNSNTAVLTAKAKAQVIQLDSSAEEDLSVSASESSALAAGTHSKKTASGKRRRPQYIVNDEEEEEEEDVEQQEQQDDMEDEEYRPRHATKGHKQTTRAVSSRKADDDDMESDDVESLTDTSDEEGRHEEEEVEATQKSSKGKQGSGKAGKASKTVAFAQSTPFSPTGGPSLPKPKRVSAKAARMEAYRESYQVQYAVVQAEEQRRIAGAKRLRILDGLGPRKVSVTQHGVAVGLLELAHRLGQRLGRQQKLEVCRSAGGSMAKGSALVHEVLWTEPQKQVSASPTVTEPMNEFAPVGPVVRGGTGGAFFGASGQRTGSGGGIHQANSTTLPNTSLTSKGVPLASFVSSLPGTVDSLLILDDVEIRWLQDLPYAGPHTPAQGQAGDSGSSGASSMAFRYAVAAQAGETVCPSFIDIIDNTTCPSPLESGGAFAAGRLASSTDGQQGTQREGFVAASPGSAHVFSTGDSSLHPRVIRALVALRAQYEKASQEQGQGQAAHTGHARMSDSQFVQEGLQAMASSQALTPFTQALVSGSSKPSTFRYQLYAVCPMYRLLLFVLRGGPDASSAVNGAGVGAGLAGGVDPAAAAAACAHACDMVEEAVRVRIHLQSLQYSSAAQTDHGRTKSKAGVRTGKGSTTAAVKGDMSDRDDGGDEEVPSVSRSPPSAPSSASRPPPISNLSGAMALADKLKHRKFEPLPQIDEIEETRQVMDPRTGPGLETLLRQYDPPAPAPSGHAEGQVRNGDRGTDAVHGQGLQPQQATEGAKSGALSFLAKRRARAAADAAQLLAAVPVQAPPAESSAAAPAAGARTSSSAPLSSAVPSHAVGGRDHQGSRAQQPTTGGTSAGATRLADLPLAPAGFLLAPLAQQKPNESGLGGKGKVDSRALPPKGVPQPPASSAGGRHKGQGSHDLFSLAGSTDDED